MRLCVFTEPQQGASYDDLLRVARRAEECGFDGFFRSDHFLAIGGDGLPGPTDSWVTLAGLALQTSRIRLGTLVGTGWYEAEHRAYGIPYPPLKQRFERLTEQLEIITGLWTTPPGSTFTYRGAWYDLLDSPGLPKPAQSPRPPIIVGGKGLRRTPMLAARFADELNVSFASAKEAAAVYEAAARASQTVDRDGAGRAALALSAALTVVCGRNDAEVRRRADAIGRNPAEMRARGGVAGTPEEVVEQLREYAQHGASRFFLQILDLTDLDHLDLIAAEVPPRLG
jgi:alkanesulfonate monooxygenase SsuD/methylene tetrahydromethanopterin reductase-like flavin-dependent oxidoreductase (luciferase family)